ncbi:MAG: hypothetical protein L0956_01575 [Candidatus Mariimomonas ferrooxydans]
MHARKHFLIERPRLGLGSSYEFEKDDRRGPDINRSDTTMTYSERLDIETEGWAYDPALVTYRLRLSPEWEQQSEKSEKGKKRTRKTFLQGYFTEFTFLRYKPYTLRVFANRKSATLNSSFAQRSKTESEAYGATQMLKYKVLPTFLSYRHLESTQTGFFDTDKDIDEFHLSTRYNRNLGDTNLKASYIDKSQTTHGTLVNTKQQLATLQNTYDLTEDKRILLSPSLYYNNTETDFTKSTAYNVSESLFWRHRKNLTTNYTFRYDITDFQATRRESKALEFNLTHLLYENLTTSIDADGVENKFSGDNERDYGAGLGFNYKRRMPGGRLNINTGYNYRINSSEVTSDFIQVIDESITLATGNITLLANENADIDSIVVTDGTGLTVYLKDVHYRATEIDSFVRISLIPGIPGGINDGDTVLVDYLYLGNPAFDYSTFGQFYGINLNFWSAWKLYYRFNHFKQKFLSGIPPDRLTDDTIHIVGTELEWKWSRTSFESQNRQTTNIPLTTWRVKETVIPRPFKRVFFPFSGSYGKSKFTDTGEIETFNSARANIQIRTSSWSKFNVQGFRDNISGRAEEIAETGVSSIFKWHYRIWNGGLSYSFSNREDKIAQVTYRNHYLLFEIKRELF